MLTRHQKLGKPVRIIPIRAFSDNYIWTLIDKSHNRVAVVDPGDAQPVIDYLEKHQLQLSDILITHYHNDHIGGVKTLKERYDCKVYASKADNLPFTDHFLIQDDQVSIFDNSIKFKVLEVPGHTMGHIAYYSQDENMVFCGDTLFRAGCGRMFEGTPEVFYQSLKKLAQLPENTHVYCTHEYTLANLAFAETVEPNNLQIKQLIAECQNLRADAQETVPSTIASELATNPFLRCEQDQVVSFAAQSNGVAFEQLKEKPVETFATIRRLKDNF